MRTPAVLLGFLVAFGRADAQESPTATPRPVALEVPLLDAPFNTRGAFPSMRQSLTLSRDFHHLLHRLDAVLEGGGVWGAMAVVGLDVLAAYLPLGEAWLHEEYHRAVLSRRGISSFNDVYKMRLLAETIAVSHVRDEDLVRLKREHPAEQVRLSAAGLEAEHDFIRELEKDSFFDGAPARLVTVAWLTKLNGSLYVLTCGTQEGDRLTDELNAEDGADVPRRDFTGLDFTAWVYDLHRPFEPYEARGVHPSGIGIDRYRKLDHLTREEADYLRLQGRLTFLNFLDPHLVGQRGFRGPAGTRWMALMRHDLTPFGYSIEADLFVRRGRLKAAAAARAYINRMGVSPGLELEARRWPVALAGRRVALSPRVAVWLQPRDQLFRSTSRTPGGLLALRADFGTRRLVPYVEVEAKTEGWVAGHVYLGSNVSARAGLRTWVF